METIRFAVVLLLELVPLFILISAGVYFFVESLTPRRIRRLLDRRSAWVGVPLASALGALTPFCSCSTVPLVNGMREAGIPVAPMVAFLIASPLIHPVAVALLWSAIGMEYAVLYTVAAMGIAVLGGLLVAAWDRIAADGWKPETAGADGASKGVGADVARASGAPAGTLRERGARALRRGWEDFRGLAIPLVLAVVVGAVIHGYVPTDLLSRLAGPDVAWAVPVAALLGIPVYASILVLLPLGTSLLAKGVGIGAVTAFLMGSAGFSLPEGILLSKVLPKALLIRVLVVFSAGVVTIGYLFQWLTG